MRVGDILQYYVARYSTDMLLSFEFVVALATFIFLLVLRKMGELRETVWVFLVGTAVHTLLEGMAEWHGIRTTEHGSILGIPVAFPVTSMVIGAFEGGVVVTVAFLLVKALSEHSALARRLFLGACALFAVIGAVGVLSIHQQLQTNPAGVAFTRRAMFAPTGLVLLAVLFSISASYFFLRRNVSQAERRSFLHYYVGIVLFTTILALPLHVGHIRFIEIPVNGGYEVAGFWQQVVVMYAFNLPLEAGWYVCTFVLLHALHLTPFRRPQGT